MVQRIVRVGNSSSQSIVGTGKAAEVIPQFCAVLLDEQCLLANPGLSEHAGRRIGLSLNNANIDDTVNILLLGLSPVNPNWNWVEGIPVYVAERGILSQSPPTSGYLIIIGYPRETNSIFIDPIFPIFRG